MHTAAPNLLIQHASHNTLSPPRVRADIQIMPHPADLITSIGRSSTKGEEASKSPAVVSAERSAKATPSSSSKRVRSVLIEKGTTVAVKGVSEQSASGTEWWLGKLEADLLSDVGLPLTTTTFCFFYVYTYGVHTNTITHTTMLLVASTFTRAHINTRV